MRVLVDTSALLALSRRRDQYHTRAVGIAEKHLATGGRFVGTTLILGEFHSHLLYVRGADEARATVLNLLDDPIHEWIEVAAGLTRDSVVRWLNRFPDQRFSLIDAVSFEVMRRARISTAFAFDNHFEVAGFELLK